MPTPWCSCERIREWNPTAPVVHTPECRKVADDENASTAGPEVTDVVTTTGEPDAD